MLKMEMLIYTQFSDVICFVFSSVFSYSFILYTLLFTLQNECSDVITHIQHLYIHETYNILGL